MKKQILSFIIFSLVISILSMPLVQGANRNYTVASFSKTTTSSELPNMETLKSGYESDYIAEQAQVNFFEVDSINETHWLNHSVEGHYKGVYSFNLDYPKTQPNYFSFLGNMNGSIEPEIDNHNKILNLTGASGYNELKDTFSTQTEGNISLYFRINGSSSRGDLYIGKGNAFIISIDLSNNIKYYNSTALKDSGYNLIPNTWHLMEFQFNSTNLNMTFDGTQIITNTNMYQSGSELSEFRFKYLVGELHIDAIDYSWSNGYYWERNTDLNISSDLNTWQAYSYLNTTGSPMANYSWLSTSEYPNGLTSDCLHIEHNNSAMNYTFHPTNYTSVSNTYEQYESVLYINTSVNQMYIGQQHQSSTFYHTITSSNCFNKWIYVYQTRLTALTHYIEIRDINQVLLFSETLTVPNGLGSATSTRDNFHIGFDHSGYSYVELFAITSNRSLQFDLTQRTELDFDRTYNNWEKYDIYETYRAYDYGFDDSDGLDYLSYRPSPELFPQVWKDHSLEYGTIYSATYNGTYDMSYTTADSSRFTIVSNNFTVVNDSKDYDLRVNALSIPQNTASEQFCYEIDYYDETLTGFCGQMNRINASGIMIHESQANYNIVPNGASGNQINANMSFIVIPPVGLLIYVNGANIATYTLPEDLDFISFDFEFRKSDGTISFFIPEANIYFDMVSHAIVSSKPFIYTSPTTNDELRMSGVYNSTHHPLRLMHYGYELSSVSDSFKFSIPSIAGSGYEPFFEQLVNITLTVSDNITVDERFESREHYNITVIASTDYNSSTYNSFDQALSLNASDFAPDTLSKTYYINYNVSHGHYSNYENYTHYISAEGAVYWSIWIKVEEPDIFQMIIGLLVPFCVFLIFPFIFKDYGRKGSVIGVSLGMIFGFFIMGYTGFLDLLNGMVLAILSLLTLGGLIIRERKGGLSRGGAEDI